MPLCKKRSLFFLFFIVLYAYFVYGVYVPYRLNWVLVNFPFGMVSFGESIRSFLIIFFSTVCVIKLIQKKEIKEKMSLCVPFVFAFYILLLNTIKLLVGLDNPFSVFLPLIGSVAVELIMVALVTVIFFRFLVLKPDFTS